MSVGSHSHCRGRGRCAGGRTGTTVGGGGGCGHHCGCGHRRAGSSGGHVHVTEAIPHGVHIHITAARAATSNTRAVRITGSSVRQAL